MFYIKKNVLTDELKYKGSVILKYEIEYPEVISNSFKVNVFNEFNLHKALELEKYAKETLFLESQTQYDYNVDNGYPIMVYELISKYSITYNCSPLISLYQDEYVFSGGAHGSTIRTSQNWNLDCGYQFSLCDVYSDCCDYMLYILRTINAQIQEKGVDLFFDDYCCLVLESFDSNHFYLTPDYVVVYFQQYDIAPYSTGIPTFWISYC